jgi:hypothetical protein
MEGNREGEEREKERGRGGEDGLGIECTEGGERKRTSWQQNRE